MPNVLFWTFDPTKFLETSVIQEPDHGGIMASGLNCGL